ncbi:RICIN domain-containing protein [Streptomyces atratus]|uniref:RICIN domain-containing protein n=1 Tax=Streptomyces atratus TaxID=1893 RepID=UPI0022505E16|nr:RICIN domain-containing protein [Streptomyces atratus]MCX5341322.1 RICIN domain-containing protein [Streptomyces atratus]
MIAKQRDRRRGRITAALVALSSLAALISGAQQAVAANDPPKIEDAGRPFKSEDASGFVLHPREMPGVDEGQTARSVIEGAEAKGVVTRVSPLSVAQSKQHIGRSLCHTTGINGTFKYNGFCWDETDDKTNAWANGWHPQGFTASHDADPSGTVDGHHLYMATWYYGVGGGDNDRNKKARISILESTGTERTYGHVLLVQPTGSRANPQFTSVDDIHADGMVWYGNRLFVANGGELQIYDLDHLWKVNSLSDKSGISGGTSSAEYHQWALPMVARYSNRTKAQQDAAEPADRSDMNCDGAIACLSSLSLDRSTSPPRLVSGRYGNAERTPPVDVIRWPIEHLGEGGTSPVKAEAAYAAPVHGLQGVATDGTYYYMSAMCDTGHMGVTNPASEDAYYCIWQAKPNGPVSILTRTPPLTQNLSFSFSSGRLWGMNERNGKRVVFSLLPRMADNYQYLYNDYSKLCSGVGSKIENSRPVIQWGCNNAQDERWVFEETKDNNGNPAYFIQNTHSGKCLGTGNSLADGKGVIQYTCNTKVDEKWWYDQDTHELRNVYSGKCLGLGSAAQKGSQLIQWTCNGSQDERWTISRTAPNV